MQEPESPKLQLSVLQIIAGGLAAMTAAAVTSTLGVAGTLIGAALMSIIATVGSALYNHSFEQARTRIRIRRNPRTGLPEQEVIVPTRPRRLPWGRIAGMAGLVFALALAGITAGELMANRRLSTFVQQLVFGRPGTPPPASARTTVGTLLRGGAAPQRIPMPEEPADAPTAPTVTTTPDETTPAEVTPPSATATPAATPTAPSAEVQPTSPPTTPEPTPRPNPPDTPSPPAEQP